MEFQIETGVEKRPGRAPHNAELFEAIFETMKRLEVGQSFFIPAAKANYTTIAGWVSKKLIDRINKTLLSIEARKNNPYWFSCISVRDGNKKLLGTRIFRDK